MPSTTPPVAPLVAAGSMLRIACRAAARVVRNRLVVEEAGERAVHELTLACLQGRSPAKPEAWVRVVAQRSACALLRTGWANTRPYDEQIASPCASPARGVPSGSDLQAAIAPRLSPRQRDALDAALTCNTTRDAARQCGMKPRDFRRYLATIGVKARRVLVPPAVDSGHAAGMHPDAEA